MLPSMVHDMRTTVYVDILDGQTLNAILLSVPATFNPTSVNEQTSDIGLDAESDAAFYFAATTGALPAIVENNVIQYQARRYTIVSVINLGGEQDRLQVLVRYR